MLDLKARASDQKNLLHFKKQQSAVKSTNSLSGLVTLYSVRLEFPVSSFLSNQQALIV